jgi:hypothetical protein
MASFMEKRLAASKRAAARLTPPAEGAAAEPWLT